MLIFLVFAAVSLFQSTHPVRGGTTEGDISAFRQGISIHPPREGWDYRGGYLGSPSGHFNPPTP